MRRWRLAAAVERDSEHTIAQGVVKSAEERGSDYSHAPNGFQAIPGLGVQADVTAGRCYWEVRHCCADAMRTCLRRFEPPSTARRRAARPPSTMIDGDSPLAVFAVADAIRAESREAIERLHAQCDRSDHDDWRRARRRAIRRRATWDRYGVRRGVARAEGLQGQGSPGAWEARRDGRRRRQRRARAC